MIVPGAPSPTVAGGRVERPGLVRLDHAHHERERGDDDHRERAAPPSGGGAGVDRGPGRVRSRRPSGVGGVVGGGSHEVVPASVEPAPRATTVAVRGPRPRRSGHPTGATSGAGIGSTKRPPEPVRVRARSRRVAGYGHGVGWLQRLLGGDPDGARPRWDGTTGRPTSSNGASSLHLFWSLPPTRPSVAVEAVLEIVEPPTVPALYFWALQVGFAGPRGDGGGAHLGLQWFDRHPGSTAVNWGGYRSGGGELDGSVSDLPSTAGNVNTRDYGWQPGRRYRLRVERAGEGPGGTTAWRGSVTDLHTGVATVVRDLWAAGDHLVSPMVWSEVFAACDDPSTSVAWSDLAVIDAEGTRTPVHAGAGELPAGPRRWLHDDHVRARRDRRVVRAADRHGAHHEAGRGPAPALRFGSTGRQVLSSRRARRTSPSPSSPAGGAGRGGRGRRARSRRRRRRARARRPRPCRCGWRRSRAGRPRAQSSAPATSGYASSVCSVIQVGGDSSISPASRAGEGGGRRHPGVVVDLAVVDRHLAVGRGCGEEPRGEALDRERWRGPVGEPHQLGRIDQQTGFLLGLADRRGPSPGLVVVGRRSSDRVGAEVDRCVGGVDPPAREHPVPAGEGQLGVALHQERLEPGRGRRGGRPPWPPGSAVGSRRVRARRRRYLPRPDVNGEPTVRSVHGVGEGGSERPGRPDHRGELGHRQAGRDRAGPARGDRRR